MANDVQVTFSAQIGQLISGVDQAKEAIRSIGGVVNSAASVFTGFGEAFAGAFAVDQAADFISQMQDLGTSTLRTAAELGISTTQAQQLGFIAKETGGDANGLAQAMERLQLNLQHAQSSTSLQALALKSLGLSAKDLISLPLNAQLDRIADSFAKFADGPNKTAIALELFGRSGADMIPILDRGSAGMDKLRKSAEDAGIIVSRDTVTALDKAGTASTTLRASVTSLGEAIVAQMSPALVKVEGDLAVFTGDLSALIQTSHFGETAMVALSGAIRETAVNIAYSAKEMADLAQPWRWNQVLDDWKKGNEGFLAIQHETDAKLVAMATQAKTELSKILSTDDHTNKTQPPPLAVPNTSALTAAMSAAQEQMKLTDEVYQQAAEKLSSEVKLHLITYSAETQALLAALDARQAAELAALAKEQQIGGLSASQYQKITNEKLQIDQKYAQDRQKIMDQAQQKEINDWKSAVGPIESAFNSQITSLLAGTETFGQAMKKVFADMVTDIIKELLELAVEEAIVFAVTGSFGSVGSMGTGIVGGIGKVLGFDVGTNYVVQSGLAMIHQGEQIVPAQGSGPYTGGTGTGGGAGPMVQFHFNGPVIGNQAWINSMVPQLTRAMNGYQAINPSTG